MSSGRQLGVDLYELWHAGQSLIPDVAAEFDAAYNGVNDGAGDSFAWYRGGGLGVGGSYGPHSDFQALAQTLGGYLARTYNNLYYVGEALVEAANDFANTDAEAAAEFESRKSQVEGQG